MNNKLRVGFTSDIHLEFGDLVLKNNNDIDVLVFAGDICTPHTWKANHSNGARREANRQIEFFFRIENDFPDIPKLLICGNHEHYKGEYNDTITIMKAVLPSTWCIGDNLNVVIDDVQIFAQTLWTNFRNRNANDMIMARGGMNDFRQISLNGNYFLPEHTVDVHERSMKHMEDNWLATKRQLVVSHHLPSYQSVTPGFRDSLLNPAYASDLDNWIIERKPVAWIHGHSHVPVNYMIGDTRIISNPRGYIGYEKNVDPNYNYKLIEI